MENMASRFIDKFEVGFCYNGIVVGSKILNLKEIERIHNLLKKDNK